MSDRRVVVGCMTGTSIDAIDAAVVCVEGRGVGARALFLGGATRSLGGLGDSLRDLANQAPMTAGAITHLSLEFGTLHAQIIAEALATARDRAPGRGAERAPDLVAVHGQTVFHAPPASWQMVNPWPIVHAIGAPVVYDLRGADLAAGGQGAPITPLADWMTLRDERKTVCVVNLGGFCNITVLPGGGGPETVRGFDVCVCNQLLDEIAREELGVAFDEGGKRALAASARTTARDELVSQLKSRGSRRSLGTGDERTAWRSNWRGRVGGDELARAAAEAIGAVIGAECAAHGAARVLLAGGGAKHAVLTRSIGAGAGVETVATDEFGVPGEYREAMAIGLLGALSADGVSITLEGVTGSKRPARAGCWVYPSC